MPRSLTVALAVALALAFSFACHSERSEEPPYFAFAVVLPLLLAPPLLAPVIVPPPRVLLS